MSWSYFCFFVWAISYGYPIAAAADSSTVNSTSNGSSFTIELVISYIAAGGNRSFDLTNATEFLKNNSMNYTTAVLKDGINSQNISVQGKNGANISLMAIEITNGLRQLNAISFNATSIETEFSNYSDSFSKLILVEMDPCTRKKSADGSGTVTEGLINLVTNYSVKGFRVNLPIFTDATNAPFIRNLNSSLPPGDYILSMNNSWQGNPSRVIFLKGKFCPNPTGKKEYNSSTPAPSPTPASNTTLTPTSVQNATNYNGTTADQNFTTTVTRHNNTNTTTSGNAILNAVVAHKSGASVALGIIVVLLILIIVGLVFRRKIMHCIRVKRMRVNVNTSDNQDCSVNYGTLYQNDDL